MFEGRKLIIATKHQKEEVIAPIFERELGVICFTDQTFDTDQLGTFSGEIERVLDPISTAREKCLLAMRANDCDLGIASEGSFGPHPSLFFIQADDEFLIFIDTKNNLEIIARELSTSTNFNGKEIESEEDLMVFAEVIGFPEHGLILRKSRNENMEIHKGIRDFETMKSTFAELSTKFPSIYVETDMRAMHNPTRMQVIEKASHQLIQKIKTTCPECKKPGFGIRESKKGLPCNLCGAATNSILSLIHFCQHCQFSKEQLYPHSKMTEDPMYCDHCNP